MRSEGVSFDDLKKKNISEISKITKVLDTKFFPESTIYLYAYQRNGEELRGDIKFPIEKHIINERFPGWDYNKDGSCLCTDCEISVLNPSGKCTCEYDVKWEHMDRLLHFYYIHKDLMEKHPNRFFPITNECENILKKYTKSEKVPKLEGLTFYTIVPEERLPFNDCQINKLRLFCEKRFTAKNFEKCSWVIESGKHEENPNLHIHCIGKLKNKNFKRHFITQWNKIYEKKYNIEYDENDNRGWDMKPCNTAEIQEDKKNYLNNALKGTHENFVDLKIGHSFGW